MFNSRDPELLTKLSRRFRNIADVQKLCILSGFPRPGGIQWVGAPAGNPTRLRYPEFAWACILTEARHLNKVADLCAAARNISGYAGPVPILEEPFDSSERAGDVAVTKAVTKRQRPPQPSKFVTALSLYYTTLPDVRNLLSTVLFVDNGGWGAGRDRSTAGWVQRNKIISDCCVQGARGGVVAVWWAAMNRLSTHQLIRLYRLMCEQYVTAAPYLQALEK